LGDYLERQRASFPRFYFIGDEDLLEIIGNSKDIDKLQKHLRKMFAGLALLRLDENYERVIGMASMEGEEVDFVAPVVLKSAPKVHQWLTRVECAMRLTLAARLRECVAAGADIPLADSARMTAWIGSWPAQLGLLAVQARFTAAVEAALSSKE
jgi:dynein heavy chain 1